ncbi:hypothetical protein BDQ17DRAFT_1334519 [Cyathus striatus]|nr:hypothetical protein BDQ17DRAFT_1334519 [Cyathus striatus]
MQCMNCLTWEREVLRWLVVPFSPPPLLLPIITLGYVIMASLLVTFCNCIFNIKYAILKQQKNQCSSLTTNFSQWLDTTAEPATKKPAITADEEVADNSAKWGKGDGGKGRGGKKRGRGGCKTAGDKDKEDKAASDAANKDKSKAGTENVSQDSNEEDEDKDGSDNVDVDDDNNDEGEDGEEVEKGNEDNVAVVGPADMDKPITKDLHKMFGAAETSWHHWDKVLKVISSYPYMEKWLSSTTPPDAKTTHELWGLEKTTGFTQVDLEHWIMRKKNISAGKGKQKAEGGKTKKGSDLKSLTLLAACTCIFIYDLWQQYHEGNDRRTPISSWMNVLATTVHTVLGDKTKHLFSENQIPTIVDNDEVISEIAIKLDKFAKFLGLHPYNDDGYFTQELGPITEKKITPGGVGNDNSKLEQVQSGEIGDNVVDSKL